MKFFFPRKFVYFTKNGLEYFNGKKKLECKI